jgi:hypothetical protein
MLLKFKKGETFGEYTGREVEAEAEGRQLQEGRGNYPPTPMFHFPIFSLLTSSSLN